MSISLISISRDKQDVATQSMNDQHKFNESIKPRETAYIELNMQISKDIFNLWIYIDIFYYPSKEIPPRITINYCVILSIQTVIQMHLDESTINFKICMYGHSSGRVRSHTSIVSLIVATNGVDR